MLVNWVIIDSGDGLASAGKKISSIEWTKVNVAYAVPSPLPEPMQTYYLSIGIDWYTLWNKLHTPKSLINILCLLLILAYHSTQYEAYSGQYYN